MVSKVDFPRASFAHLKAAYHNLGLLKILYRMLKALCTWSWTSLCTLRFHFFFNSSLLVSKQSYVSGINLIMISTELLQYFLACFTGNIANYLKLLQVDSMYLPVPVNFIFVGFEGKGNQGIYIYCLLYSYTGWILALIFRNLVWWFPYLFLYANIL